MHPIDALAPVAMFAVIGTAVVLLLEDVVRWYRRRKALDRYLSFITARTLFWMEQQRKEAEK